MIWGNTKPPLGTKLNIAHPLAKGIVAVWPLNEYNGNIINDISGEKQNLQGTNLSLNQWDSSMFGRSIKTAETSYFTSPSSIHANTRLYGYKYSVSIWWKAFIVPAWCGPIHYKGGATYGFQFVNENSSTSLFKPHLVSCYDKDETGGNYKGSYNISIPFDKFYHFVWTVDGNTVKLYINGVKDQVASSVAGWGSERIIKLGYAYNKGTTGLIELPIVYNRVLTENEAIQLYKEPFCMFNQ